MKVLNKIGKTILHSRYVSIPRTASNGISVMMQSVPKCECVGHRKLKPEELPSCLTWCTVRNTYDRVVSMCEYNLSYKAGNPQLDGNPMKKDKVALLQYYLTEYVPKRREVPTATGHSMALPQLVYITDINHTVSWYIKSKIYKPLDTNVYVDIILDYSNLEKEYSLMCRLLGIKNEYRFIEHTKAVGRDPDYKVYYNKENRSIVEDMFSDDIEYFNHAY